MALSIWVIEDSRELREEIFWELVHCGFSAQCFATGQEALEAVGVRHPDIILLDSILPDMKADEFCARAAEKSNILPPVIVIAPDGEVAGELLSGNMLIGDCIVKPFSPGALVTRIYGILDSLAPKTPSERFVLPENKLKPKSRIVWAADNRRVQIDKKLVQLAPVEHKLLGILLSEEGAAFSRQDLLKKIWNGDSNASERSIDVAMVSLRRKLGAAGISIQTVRGIGYKYVG